MCASCTRIATPYGQQLIDKQQHCAQKLPSISAEKWLPAFASADRSFRNRAKLVVGGIVGNVTLGILSPELKGVDLGDCLIYEPAITSAIPVVRDHLNVIGLEPYDVGGRHGEVKFAHITSSPDGQLMLRFVVRSEHAVRVLSGHLDRLRAELPMAQVITANVLPEHKAVLEGDTEVVLFGDTLEMVLKRGAKELKLHLGPQSFFQTNTVVAQALYAQVTEWITQIRPDRLWDLYCGVGGFALMAASALRDLGQKCEIWAVELSEAAVSSARRSAQDAQLSVNVVTGDATEVMLRREDPSSTECIVVNPPRRGIGQQLCESIETSQARYVVYSSCNPVTLARDLDALSSFEVREARLFDMFAHTDHLEVAVLLERRPGN